MEDTMEQQYENFTKNGYVTNDLEMVAVGGQILGPVLACLRAMSISYQTSHWTVYGSHFFQDHLLFERLYNSTNEEIDSLAEKIGGVMGTSQLKLAYQAPLMFSYLQGFSQVQDPIKRGLHIERFFLQLIEQSIEDLKGFGLMTIGLEDLLITLASNHESNLYLLQQIVEPRTAKLNRRVSEDIDAAEIFYKDPRKVEVSQFAESNAVSNDPTTFKNTLKEDRGHQSPLSQEKKEYEASPLTPDEILELPGGSDVSTLNRFVVESEQPDLQGAVKMNQSRQARRNFKADFNGYGYPIYKQGDSVPRKGIPTHSAVGVAGWSRDQSSFTKRISPEYTFLALRNADSENNKYIDRYTMYMVDNRFSIVKRFGTHGSARGVLAWLQAREGDGRYDFDKFLPKRNTFSPKDMMDRNKWKFANLQSKMEKYIQDLLSRKDAIFIEDLTKQVMRKFKVDAKQVSQVLEIMFDDGIIETDSSAYIYLID